MEDVLIWLFWVAIIVGSIASSVSKAKKKQEEEARRGAQQTARHAAASQKAAKEAAGRRGVMDSGSGTGYGAGSGAGETLGTGTGYHGPAQGSGQGFGQWTEPASRSTGGTFANVLKELSRQLNEQPSPTVVTRPTAWPSAAPRPASASATRPASAYPSRTSTTYAPQSATASQPAATSHDYYSLEEDYEGTDIRGYGTDYGVGRWADGRYGTEESDAEKRYVGGEMRDAGRDVDNQFDSEIVAYERLAAQRTQRSTIAPVGSTVQSDISAAGSTDYTPTTLQELLGGEFDLRRAVIEAEILTPKWEGPQRIWQ